MDYHDPQIMAIVFLIPALVGLALVGEGFEEYKKGNGEWFTLVSGVVFLIAVILIYLYFAFFKYL
jgi:hypothetical protein